MKKEMEKIVTGMAIMVMVLLLPALSTADIKSLSSF